MGRRAGTSAPCRASALQCVEPTLPPPGSTPSPRKPVQCQTVLLTFSPSSSMASTPAWKYACMAESKKYSEKAT